MSINTQRAASSEAIDPQDGGRATAESAIQLQWITTIKDHLEILFQDDPNVFIAGDLLWYPDDGDHAIRTAPNLFVVFGRPKGYRESFQQWEENGIGPQITFEILSRVNCGAVMARKFRFYERYGVEEFYLYDTEINELIGWFRTRNGLEELPTISGWTSPRLGVRFERGIGSLQLQRPDGRPLMKFIEPDAKRDANEAERQALKAENAKLESQVETERQRAERLAAQLRAMGVDPER